MNKNSTFMSNSDLSNNLHNHRLSFLAWAICHLSPQSWVCTDDSHCEVIHLFTHSFPFTHSHSKYNLTTKPETHQTCIQLVVLFLSCCCPMWWVTFTKVATCSSGLGYFGGLLTYGSTWKTTTVGRYVQQKLQHSRAALPFLITETMTINPTLFEWLPWLIHDNSGTWCLMMSSSQTLEVRASTSFPTVQSLRRWCHYEVIHSFTRSFPFTI